jgi:hypothetical protein
MSFLENVFWKMSHFPENVIGQTNRVGMKIHDAAKGS